MMDRLAICRDHGFRDEAELYATIVAAAHQKKPELLLVKRLNGLVLGRLGYDLANMRRIGFCDDDLAALGYIGVPRPQHHSDDDGLLKTIRDLIAQGLTAGQFHERGFNIHHLKKASVNLPELERLGFTLDDFARAYSAAELKRSGYGIKELVRFFPGNELRVAGFSAAEMRAAGYQIRDLQKFGYNENHIRTAGYSLNDLSRAGLSRQTVDKTRFNR